MAEPIILGVDPSWTGFAMCAGSSVDGKDFDLEEQRISTEAKDWPSQYRRLDHIGEAFMNFVNNVFPAFVAIEGYAMGSKTRPQQAGELGGHIRWLLAKADIPFIIVPPTTLKEFVLGSGKAKKELMMMRAFKRWGHEAKDNDACDAHALMRLAWWYQQETKTKTKSLQKICRACEPHEVLGA